jgi:hypothetical protein
LIKRSYFSPAAVIRKQLLVFFAVAIFVVYIFLLNLRVPMFADDYCRSHDTLSIWIAMQSAYKDYLRWSGRLPVMFFNRLFFSSGSYGLFVLALLSTMVMLYLTWLIAVLARVTNRNFYALIPIITFYFLFWFSTDVIGEAALWKTGQIQYLWGAVFALACFAPVVRYCVHGDQFTPGATLRVLYLVCCLLSGMWLESTSVAVSVMWLSMLLYSRVFLKRPVPAIFWVALGLWLLGTAILVAAPGNFRRLDVIGEQYTYVEKILPISERFLAQIDIKVLLLGGVFAFVAWAMKAKDFPKILYQSAIFFLLAALCAYTTIGAPRIMYEGRVAFHSEFFMFVSIISLYPTQSNFSKMGLWRVRIATIGMLGTMFACLLLLVLDGINVYGAYRSISEQDQRRAARIERLRALGESNITVPALYFAPNVHTYVREVNSGRRFARDITRDPKRWENACVARYYKISKLSLQ